MRVHGSGGLSNRVPFAEQHERRNASDAESGHELLLLVGIHLEQSEVGFQVGRGTLLGGSHGQAWPAPRCPEVHNDANVAAGNLAFKRIAICRHGPAREQRLMACPALGPQGGLRHGHTVHGRA